MKFVITLVVLAACVASALAAGNYDSSLLSAGDVLRAHNNARYLSDMKKKAGLRGYAPVGVEGCSDTCRNGTSGPCQHPNKGDDSCYEVNELGKCHDLLTNCDDNPGYTELIAAPDGNIVQNTLVAEGFVMPQNNYQISFDFTGYQLVDGWSSVFHFTANGLNGGRTGRVPALFVYANELKLHWVCGTADSKNRAVASTYVMDLGQTYHIDLKVINSVATIWVDGDVTNGDGQMLGEYLYDPQTTQLYIGDPWYPAAGANLKNFVVYDLAN